MKKLITFIVFFNAFYVYAQEEKKYNISFEDGIFKNSVNLNYELSDEWSIGMGLESKYNLDAKSVSIPFGFKYKVNDKLNVFADHLWYTSKNTGYNLSKKTFFGTATRVGGAYNFSDKINTKVFYLKNHNADKNYDSGLYNFKNELNLNFGFKF